ncbi:MAG: hypothetical protein AAF727_16095 [Pseudomonadota bacterium]
MTGAATRGLLVALVIALPALLLPGIAPDSTQVTVLVALLAAFLTFVEYNADSPSIVEFRDAGPFNRLRFIALFSTVFLITVACRGLSEPTLLTSAVWSIGTLVGNSMDFPYSPVRMVVLMFPVGTDAETITLVRVSAGIAYLSALCAMFAFIVMVRIFGWPARGRAFNVWINLPLFDPTVGGDVLLRLSRDARVNIVVGFLLPFIIPALIKLAATVIDPLSLTNHQTLVWTITAWAFLPASMIMRGIAMQRIAEMIAEQRRRAYVGAEEGDLQPA